MRLNYRFSNLCGPVYKEGNLEYTPDGTGIFVPVGKRVTFFDLVNNEAFTFPFELPTPVARTTLSPNGSLLLVVDREGQAVLASVARRSALHWINFRAPVTAMRFSPDGGRVAIAMGAKVRVWVAPSGERREFAPFVLDRKMVGHSDDIVSLAWSSDSRYLLSASLDMTARVYDTVDVRKGFKMNPRDHAAVKSVELRGHQHPLEAAYFAGEEDATDDRIITVARNGSIWIWGFAPNSDQIVGSPRYRGTLLVDVNEEEEEGEGEEKGPRTSQRLQNDDQEEDRPKRGTLFRTKLDAVAFSRRHNFVAAALSNGVFAVFSTLRFERLYALTLTQSRITSLALNNSGEWLALGVGETGQLLVWEWRSESFVLKQQGHAVPMNSVAYSPDGQTMASGSADGKVKLWTAHTGLCFVTFAEHTGAVHAVEFTSRTGKVVVSASADGTVRAYDLIRYRNFRTLTTPTPVQFLSLAIDPSGEIVAAGTLDTFEIYLWSLQTGQLLEVLGGHTGPISALAFDPLGHRLASGSWDRSVRLWDVFARDHNVQTLDHGADVLALAFRPDGQQLAVSTLRGEILQWDVELAQVTGTIPCQRDIADRPLCTVNIKTLGYTPDGSLLLVGGNFSWVGFYHVDSRILLRRFPIVKSRLEHKKKDESQRANGNGEPQTMAVRMAPTGRAFVALTTEGLMIFSLDETLHFDPFDLEVDITPERIEAVLHQERNYIKAFVMALRLNIVSLTERVFLHVPITHVSLLVRALPVKYLLAALNFLAPLAARSRNLQRLLLWSAELLRHHALTLRQDRIKYGAVLRLLLKNTRDLYGELGKVTNETVYALDFFCDAMQGHTLTDASQ